MSKPVKPITTILLAFMIHIQTSRAETPQVDVIPTMGQWGLLSLGILILIVGVGVIKQHRKVES